LGWKLAPTVIVGCVWDHGFNKVKHQKRKTDDEKKRSYHEEEKKEQQQHIMRYTQHEGKRISLTCSCLNFEYTLHPVQYKCKSQSLMII